jgi:glycosyltransferase involved in cell wall biosynthesis
MAPDSGWRVVHVPAGPAEFVRKEDLLAHMPEFTAWMAGRWRLLHHRYDVVHANFWMSALAACDLARLFDVPTVVTFHALGRVRRHFQGADDAFPDSRFAIEDRVIAEADRIVAQCPQDARDLVRLYDAAPASLVSIPCGYDPEECHPVDRRAARERLGLPLDAPIVLQLGRLVPRKGVDDVVRAFARVHDALPAARLVIVGGESDRPDPLVTPEIGRLRAIARELGVAEAIIFGGRCDRSRLRDWYGAADVFATMPWYEPFGITPVEAMACGTPVIGARVGGIAHTVVHGETGFLVPARDAEALADRMLLLLRDDALRRRLGAQGIERARRHFTWSTVVDRFEALFLELVGTRMRDQSHVRGRARIARPARAQSDAPARALGIGS